MAPGGGAAWAAAAALGLLLLAAGSAGAAVANSQQQPDDRSTDEELLLAFKACTTVTPPACSQLAGWQPTSCTASHPLLAEGPPRHTHITPPCLYPWSWPDYIEQGTIDNAEDTLLSTWTNGTDPCGGDWDGVICVDGRVVNL